MSQDSRAHDPAREDPIGRGEGAATSTPRNKAEEEAPPFISHPDRVDKWLWAYLAVVSILSFALMPLRVWLLNHPEAYAVLVGGYTSAIIGGAHSVTGGTAAWVIVLLTLIGALKSVPLWWAIGAKWGHEYLEILVAGNRRLRKWSRRLDKLSPVWLLVAIVVSYIPFMPTILLVNLLAGIRRVSFWLVLGVNALGVLVKNGLFAYLGTVYGTQIIGVVDQINRYAMWITLALVAFAILSARRQQRQQKSRRP